MIVCEGNDKMIPFVICGMEGLLMRFSHRRSISTI